MAKHTVEVATSTYELGKADVEFSISKDGAKFGELRVSNGSVVWFPYKAQYAQKMTWSQLAKAFEEFGSEKAEKRSPTRRAQSSED